MANEIIPFQFEDASIRIHVDENGMPWWVMVDICDILGLENATQASARLKEDEKSTLCLTYRTLNICNEKGLWRLLMRSRKPEAERMQDWVFGEVLPSIRKTGQYGVPMRPTLPPLTTAERIHDVKDIYSFLENMGLADDNTRILTKEALENLLLSTHQPLGTGRQIPEHTGLDDYFQMEDLRGEFHISDKAWFEQRGTFGKVIKKAIQTIDPSCKPLHFEKIVNGKKREVNGWPNEYRTLAVSAIARHLERISESDDTLRLF